MLLIGATDIDANPAAVVRLVRRHGVPTRYMVRLTASRRSPVSTW
jgi:hypothetical protein